MTTIRNDVYLQPLQYAVAGATPIPCTKFSRRVEIWEDGSVAAYSGLIVTYPNGVVVRYAPEQYPIVLGDKTGAGAGIGRIVARPPNEGHPVYAGDNYCTVAPAGGATVVNVAEYD